MGTAGFFERAQSGRRVDEDAKESIKNNRCQRRRAGVGLARLGIASGRGHVPRCKEKLKEGLGNGG